MKDKPQNMVIGLLPTHNIAEMLAGALRWRCVGGKLFREVAVAIGCVGLQPLVADAPPASCKVRVSHG